MTARASSSSHGQRPGRKPPIPWRLAQLGVLLATFALCGALFLAPKPALALLWNVLIPVLPASFLVSPALWRNVCPLATLNMATNRTRGRRELTAAALPLAGAVGITLLFALVPARRFTFNQHGPALAVTVLAVAGGAILLGLLFDAKAGFCNAICPVLPVERLYGQSPLLDIGNPRCRPCTLCTARGCLDLSSRRAIPQLLGNQSRSAGWLLTPFGAFAAAFPGFVVGYFTVADGSLAGAAGTYLHVLLWAGASYLAAGLLVLALRLQSTIMMPALAAAAVGLYYWFAAPGMATTLHLPPAGVTAIRAAALGLVGFWWARAWPAGVRSER